MDPDPFSLCDRCLGRRLIGAAGELPQQEAGAAHRAEAGGAPVAEPDCPVCEGAFADRSTWLDLALEAAAPYEYETFQVGTTFPAPCEEHEKAASAAMGQEKVGENIRTEANRWLAQALVAKTGTSTAPEGRPDLVIQVDTRFWTGEAEANTLFLRGRYTKHSREIPQTHWPCKRCQGLGCYECERTGVMYPDSVEDAIGEPALPIWDARGYTFHGAGREDIDALMLGSGRPFVLELADPKKRGADPADLQALEAAVNGAKPERGVGLLALEKVEKPEVARIKNADYQKEYLAHCLTEAPVTEDAVQDAVDALSGATLAQRTPQRVAHRRADKVRERTVERVTLEEHRDDHHFSVRVLAESGTYIKEMVSSDDGRTTPSLANELGVPTVVAHLDVVAILDDARG